jgi:hypothetical protein
MLVPEWLESFIHISYLRVHLELMSGECGPSSYENRGPSDRFQNTKLLFFLKSEFKSFN